MMKSLPFYRSTVLPFYRSTVLLILVFILHCLTFSLTAQSNEDCDKVVTASDYSLAKNDLPQLAQAFANAAPNTVATIPVRMNVVLDHDGAYPNPNHPPIDEAYLDSLFSHLDTLFSDSLYTFDFVLCGDVNYIHDTSFQKGIMPIQDYSWVGQAVNVYVYQGAPVSFAQFPWESPGNRVFIINYDLFYSVTPHEFGHHFGLLHPFEPNAAYNVPDPDDTIQYDHPYTTNPDGHPRELVTRDTLDENLFPFPYPNCEDGGDFLCATPAGCRSGINAQSQFPGCSYNPFNCSHDGTFVDYNGMAIDDPANKLIQNFMSYTGSCRTEFVKEQKDRMFSYYELLRQHQYEPSKCGNYKDKVEYQGTNIGLDRVAIDVDNVAYQLQMLTNPEGEFNGILFYSVTTNPVTSEVEMLGPNPDFTFNHEDWLEGITTFDMVLIRKHILNTTPLDGYNQIAADVNNSGTISNLDLIDMRHLILHNTIGFPSFENPWRFIPEYIPVDHPSDFDGGGDDNPFQYELTGTQNYPMKGLSGKAGFDGIKLGDVNNTFVPGGNPPIIYGAPVELTVEQTIVGQQAIYDFKVEGFTDIVAYQMDIEFENQYLEYFDFQAQDLAGVVSEFFGTIDLASGIIYTLWYDEQNASAVTLDDFDKLFSLRFDGAGNFPNAQVNLVAENMQQLRTDGRSVQFKNFAVGADGKVHRIIQKNVKRKLVADFNILPNPFQEKLSLDIFANDDGPVQVKIINALGQTLYEQEDFLFRGENFIEIENLAAMPIGFYLVSIYNEGNVLTKKVLKQT